MDLAILVGSDSSADDKHREPHPPMPYPAAMSRASALLAALTSEPTSTSELYARVGYMNLTRVGLVAYEAFRAELVTLSAAGLAESDTGEDGSTLWRLAATSDEGPTLQRDARFRSGA
jgi:hypothetical protein